MIELEKLSFDTLTNYLKMKKVGYYTIADYKD